MCTALFSMWPLPRYTISAAGVWDRPGRLQRRPVPSKLCSGDCAMWATGLRACIFQSLVSLVAAGVRFSRPSMALESRGARWTALGEGTAAVDRRSREAPEGDSSVEERCAGGAMRRGLASFTAQGCGLPTGWSILRSAMERGRPRMPMSTVGAVGGRDFMGEGAIVGERRGAGAGGERNCGSFVTATRNRGETDMKPPLTSCACVPRAQLVHSCTRTQQHL